MEGYQAASLVGLAVGAGLYLIAPRRWQRVLALVIPAVLSPAVMGLGLYQTFPAQSWANPTDASFRLWEALQPVLYLSPLPILLLLAALAPRLPWGKGAKTGIFVGAEGGPVACLALYRRAAALGRVVCRRRMAATEHGRFPGGATARRSGRVWHLLPRQRVGDLLRRRIADRDCGVRAAHRG